MIFRIFRKPPLENVDRARLDALEKDMAQARGEYRNLLQNVESGARKVHERIDRLENVMRTLQLRTETDDA